MQDRQDRQRRIIREAQGFDVIGDVHGEHSRLVRLLARLGYSLDRTGVYRHPTHVAVFAGDLIDRGPGQREVVSLVLSMVRAGTALTVMGNHEFAAYAATLVDASGRPMRTRNPHRKRAFEGEFTGRSNELARWLRRFGTMPLWLDLDGLRVAHACYSQDAVDTLIRLGASPDGIIPEDLFKTVLHGERIYYSGLAPRSDADRDAMAGWQAFKTMNSGPVITLPAGRSFHDKDGHERHIIRIRWWEQGPRTWRRLGVVPNPSELPDTQAPVPDICRLPDIPVVFGHYWLSPNAPKVPFSEKAACVDFSAGKGGPLAAMRWSRSDGPRLRANGMVWVEAGRR